MALRQILCVSVVVAATLAAADGESEQAGSSGSYYRRIGVSLPR